MVSFVKGEDEAANDVKDGIIRMKNHYCHKTETSITLRRYLTKWLRSNGGVLFTGKIFKSGPRKRVVTHEITVPYSPA